MNRFNEIYLILALTTLGLPGCFLAPSYHRPAVETPPAFKEQAVVTLSTTPAVAVWTQATPQDHAPKGPWWAIFDDPQLNALEDKVALSNQSIKQAEAQFRQAKALVRETQASYFPTVTATPSATRNFGPNTSRGGNTTIANGAYNLFDMPLTASWEPDLWGAVAFAVRSVKAEAQASAAMLENMQLSMQAELASDYFAMQAIDMETAILNSAIESYDKAFRLTRARFNGGIASSADLAQAQAQLDGTKAQSTDLGITRAQYEHAIAVLIGQAPSSFSLPPGQIKHPPPAIPIVLPSQLLERRPDIASAERLIVAANGQIGLARAAYFPAISLTASGGYESNSFTKWFSWPNRFWSLGASAAETVLDFGRRRAVSAQAQAVYDQQVASYRQTVLAAFQEVEDNLVALRLLSQEAEQQDSADKAAEKSLALEVERYKSGIVSYLDVITTQNIALNDERLAVQILSRRMAAAVILIRAMGGGWDTSQLPWPHNMESPPPPQTGPAIPLALPNPPITVPLMISTTTAAAPQATTSPTAVQSSTGTSAAPANAQTTTPPASTQQAPQASPTPAQPQAPAAAPSLPEPKPSASSNTAVPTTLPAQAPAAAQPAAAAQQTSLPEPHMSSGVVTIPTTATPPATSSGTANSSFTPPTPYIPH